MGDGTSGHDGTITGAGGVTDNGLLAYNLFGSQTASYAITGNTNGAVTKTGGGTLTLANGGNTYGGGTNVLQGLMVIAPGSGAMQQDGPLFVSGGSLDLEGNLAVVSTLSGSGTIGNGSSGTANVASLYVDPAASASSTFSGSIHDGGFGGNAPIALNVISGTLALSGTNTYSGGTTVSDATLIVTSASGLADNSSLNVGDNLGVFPAAIVPPSSPSVSSSNVAPVPEPGTLALLAAGGLAVAAAVRRTRKNIRRA